MIWSLSYLTSFTHQKGCFSFVQKKINYDGSYQMHYKNFEINQKMPLKPIFGQFNVSLWQK